MADRSIRVVLRAEVAGYRAAMEQAARATRRVPEEGDRATGALGRMVQSADQNREAWDRSGAALTAFGAVTTGVFAGSVKAAIDWQSAWTGVLKTVDGTPGELARLEDGLREMTAILPASHAEIAAVAEAAGQLGIATPNIMAFTRTMVDLGETTNLSADEAATALARFMGVMGTSQGDVSRLGSVVVDLGNNFATTEREIVEMGQRLSAAGSVAGLTEADVLGMATAMSSVGIEAEAGGTAMSRVMIKIAKAVDEGGESVGEFAKVAGMSSQEFMNAWNDDPVTAIMAVVSGLGALTDAGGGAFQALDDLGLKDVRITNAMLSLAASGDQVTRAISMASDAWADNSALAAEAALRYDTVEAKISMAKNSIVDAGISMGEAFLPVVASAAEGVAGLATAFSNLDPKTQAALSGLTGLAGVTALSAGAFLLLFPRVMETVRGFQTLAALAPRLAAGLSLVGKATVPILAVAAAIIALDEATKRKVEAPEVGEVTAAMLDIANDVDMARGKLDQFFQMDPQNTVNVTKGLDGIADAMKRISGEGRGAVEWVNDNLNFLPLIDNADVKQIEASFEQIDTALANLQQTGAEAQAAMNWDVLVSEAEKAGLSVDDLRARFPQYIAALQETENASRLAASETGGMTAEMQAAEQATAEAAEELQKWRDRVREASMSFISPTDAYQAAIDKSMEWAQAQADATDDAEDSWSDFYDGMTVSMGQLLEEQQKQLTDQVAYNANMMKLAGQVSGEYLAYLDGLGREAAPLIATLANALPEELAASDAMYTQGLANGTNYVTALEAATSGKEVTVIMNADGTIAYEIAADTVSEVDKMAVKPWALGVDPTPAIDTAANSTIPLLSGMTVKPWDLSARPENAMSTSRQTSTSIGGMTPSAWAIDAKADPAIAEANRAQNTINAKRASITVDAVQSVGFMNSVQAMANKVSSTWANINVGASGSMARPLPGLAGGGRITGPGTPTSDSILGVGSDGVPTARVSRDEFVVNAASYQKHRGLVEAINADSLPGLATGGAVGLWERRAQQAWSQAQSAWNRGDDAGWRAADQRYKDAQSTLKQLREEQGALTRSSRRGEVTGRATSGLSGAFSVVDDLWSGARNEDYSQGARDNLWKAAASAEPAMKRLYTQADKVEKSLEAARDRAKELGAVSDGVASRLSGEFSLEGTTKQNTNARGDIWYTTGGIGANAKATAARVQAFAGKLSRLQKLGLSGGVLQELAQMGSVEGSIAADALLAGGKAEVSTTNKAFADLAKWSGQAGQYVSEGFYKGGVQAANGIVAGLESQQAAIEAQILKIAKSMESALKKALGIRSPSRMTTAIGAFTGEGLVVGMKAKRRAIEDEATAMGLAAIPGVPSGVSSASLAAASSRYAPTVNVTAPAPSLDGLAVTGQFSVGSDGLLTLVDGRIRQAESATATSVSRRY